MRHLLSLVLVAACGSRPASAPPDPCAAIDDTLIETLGQQWAREHGVAMPAVKLRDAVVAACKREHWTAVARETEKLLDSILPTHITSGDGGLAEGGPHPDYPTPVAAGTANIFLLEEPERGPPVPARANLPPRGSLVWTTHAYCEINRTTFACSAQTTGTGPSTFRVGRRGTEIAVIEERYGERVVGTTMYTMQPDGTLVQRLSLDARGRIANAYTYRDGKLTARLRNGANALEGCGYLAYTTARGSSTLTCLQWLGEPMLDTSGVATYRATRDARGFLTEEANFSADAKPILDNTGKHLYRQERDAFGRVTAVRYFDLDGKRAADPEGCSGQRFEYDDGLVARITCLDDADQARGRSNGVATREMMYDARGCRIGTRFLDKAGKPAADPDGVAGEDLAVDATCTATRKTCVDLNGDPHACGAGRPAQLRMKLDRDGNAVSVTHWSDDETPATDDEFDAFELRYRYDAVGNLIALACFSGAGTATECDGTGFHEKRTTFDANGRRSEERFVGTNGRPAHNLGAASRRYKYDNYDHPFESQSYDDHGALIEQQGAATIRELYDIRHQRFAMVLLDASGKPARYTACFTGATCPDRAWHAVRIVRLGDGTVEYNQFFDENGQLIEAIGCRTNKCFD